MHPFRCLGVPPFAPPSRLGGAGARVPFLAGAPGTQSREAQCDSDRELRSDGPSVVVCTCRRPRELRACLASLQRQSVPPKEVLVVGVEGDAESAKVVDEFTSRSCVVAVIWQKGATGLGRARNLGWASARGEWVAFIDDDAVADASWIENLAKHFRDGTTAVGGQVRDADSGRIDVDGTFSYPLRTIHVCPPGCNMAFRTSWLRQVGGFDENLIYGFDDHDIGIKLTISGAKIDSVREAVVWHRRSWGPGREGLGGPSLPGYAWSGSYLIAKFSGALRVTRVEHFARICGLLLEFLAMSRRPDGSRTRKGFRGRTRAVRLSLEVLRSLVHGTLHGLRARRGGHLSVPVAEAGGPDELESQSPRLRLGV